MKREELKPMVSYEVKFRWRKEPVRVYVSLEAPVTGVEHWKVSDPNLYVMVHRFGSDKLIPVLVSELTVLKPVEHKCSHCGSVRGSGCVQCRPDIMSY